MQVNHSARPQGIAPTTPRSGSHYRFTTVKRQTCIVGATLAVALSPLAVSLPPCGRPVNLALGFK
jgi:hypothetical protein